MAFQALFSREILPQSFSPPPHDQKVEGLKLGIEVNVQKGDEKEDASALDLNRKTVGLSSNNQATEKNAVQDDNEDGLLTIGLGSGKLKARRTGFKPYKRCSVEAKEDRVADVNQVEEKGPKRIRLEGETST